MSSYRQLFRSSAIIGGASALNMAIGVVKIKVLAVLLGPAGIGLMGIYQNVMGVASRFAGCGMETSGVRQVASAGDQATTLSTVRRALWVANLVFGSAAMAILWLLREPVAQWVFGDGRHSSEVGWLGLGVLLTLIAGSQTAVLQGLRRIDELAKISIVSALVAAAVGILAVYLWGTAGVLWFVLVAPAVNFVVASYYAARLPRSREPYDPEAIQQQWLALLKLGIPFMASGLLMLITQLAVRTIVLRELGLEASGYFQAAWAISITYVGFVLNAMAMDYFPRLSAVIGDHQQATLLVNEQVELALLLAGPALLAMITFSAWVIHSLYAQDFAPAAEILSWQALGDILKVAGWPIGFIFLATGRAGVYVGIQLVWSGAYLGTLVPWIRDFGLVMAGVGFAVAYLFLYVVVAAAANRIIGFELGRRNLQFTLLLVLAGAFTILCAGRSVAAGYALGSLATLLFGIYSWRRLNHLIDLTGWLRRRLP